MDPTGTSVRPPLPPSKCPYVHVYITSRDPDKFLFMLRAIPNTTWFFAWIKLIVFLQARTLIFITFGYDFILCVI